MFPRNSITNQMVYNNFLRFSSMYDIWLTIISVISAVSTGICLPVMIIYFGKVTESFVRIVEYNYSSVHASGNWNLSAQHSQWKQHSSLMEDTIVYSIESGTVGVISLALNAIFVTCLNIAAQNQACRIKSTFFKAVLQQDIAWHDVQSSHDFISQSTENIRKIQDGIGEKLGFMIYYISAFLACIVTALYYGWELTMIIITPLPFLTATTYFLSEQQAKLMIQETNANSEALTTAKEVFESMRTVVAFDGQQKEVERFRQQIQSTGNSVFRRSLMSGLEAGLWWLLTFVSYALAFWYGVTMVLFPSSSLSDDKSEARRKYEVSTFNIVFFSVLYAGSKINQILTLTEIFSSGKVAARSIFQIINRLPIKSTKTGLGECKNIKGQVKFDGIHFSYPSRPTVPVLRNISFNIPDGKLVALVGPSGCGKTTCFQLIQRFYDPNEGQIYLDGVPLKEYDPSWLRRHIGIVEQEPVLFATTIKENIQLGACYDQPGQDETLQEDIQRAASQANAHEFIQSLPLGYDTFIGEGGTRLSGGQKQRIALARVLMGNPKILLLDEPTSSLDALSESAIQQTLDVVCSGRTCFVIAHRMSTIRKADVILVLRDGSIVEAGSHDALITKRGFYYRLVSASSSDECKSSLHASEQGAGLHMLHQSMHTPDGEREQERSETALPVEQSSNRFAQIINVNRQIIPYIVCGFLAAIVTGLCQPIFAIFFGETLSVLTLKGADSQSEVDLIKTRILVVFLAIAFVAGVAAFAQSFSFSLASSRLSENLQILSYQSMLNQAISWFDRNENSVGALCTRLIDDPANIKAAAGLSMGAVVQALTSLIFSLALAFYYQWKLALVGSIFVPFLLLSAVLDSKVGTAQNSTVDEKNLENSNRVAVEAISNIRTVVGLNKQEYFYKIYKDIQEASTQSKVKQSIIRGLVCGWASNLDTFASIAFMYYGGYLVQHERIGVKNIFTVSESLIYGMEIVGKSFALMPNLSKVFYSADRFCSILKNSNKALSIQSQRSSDDTTEVVAEQIRFKNVGFSYPIRPDVSILEGLEVLIQAGQTVALVGPSGSGKTTCIQLLEKLYDPDHGSIYLNGHCLSEMATNSLRHQIGLVGQEPILFNRTIAENIAYGDNTRQPSVEDLIEAARQANIHNWIQSLPLSYDSNVGHRGAQLSGGQKQRVAIARALIRRPRILILDEATSALDSESELLVQQAMSNAQVGRTCIVISHRLHSIRNADRIFVLNQRRVQEQGSHHELMELGGFYSQLYMTENSSEKGDCVSVPDK